MEPPTGKSTQGLEKRGIAMIKLKPKALILCGDGVNCERETAKAFEISGALTKTVHINDLLESPKMLKDFQFMALPGGFSFGDELGSGKIMALKIKYGLKDHFLSFIESKKPLIGICNGFQILVKMGLLPWKENFDSQSQKVTLDHNDHGQFINRWVQLKVNSNKGPWLHNYDIGEKLKLPIRHGEGRIVTSLDPLTLLDQLENKNQVAFRYMEDVNGSLDFIAGLIDETGHTLGMMPHPEAFIFQATSGRTDFDPLASGDGIDLFKNAVNFVINS